MKYLICSFILTSIFGCFSTTSEVPLEKVVHKKTVTEDIQNGNVKTISESDYEVSNVFGELTKAQLEGTDVVKYDFKGNRIELVSFDSKGNPWIKTTYQYTTDSRIEEHKSYPIDSLIGKKILKTNRSEYTTELSSYDHYGKLQSIVVMSLDELENIVEECTYSSFGSQKSKVQNEYDVDHNLISRKEYFNGTLVQENLFIYNGNGNVIRNQQTKCQNCRLNNNPTEQDWYESIFTYDYVYDHKGNWIKKTEFRNSVPKRITERTYQYF